MSVCDTSESAFIGESLLLPFAFRPLDGFGVDASPGFSSAGASGVVVIITCGVVFTVGKLNAYPVLVFAKVRPSESVEPVRS